MDFNQEFRNLNNFKPISKINGNVFERHNDEYGSMEELSDIVSMPSITLTSDDLFRWSKNQTISSLPTNQLNSKILPKENSTKLSRSDTLNSYTSCSKITSLDEEKLANTERINSTEQHFENLQTGKRFTEKVILEDLSESSLSEKALSNSQKNDVSM